VHAAFVQACREPGLTAVQRASGSVLLLASTQTTCLVVVPVPQLTEHWLHALGAQRTASVVTTVLPPATALPPAAALPPAGQLALHA